MVNQAQKTFGEGEAKGGREFQLFTRHTVDNSVDFEVDGVLEFLKVYCEVSVQKIYQE